MNRFASLFIDLDYQVALNIICCFEGLPVAKKKEHFLEH